MDFNPLVLQKELRGLKHQGDILERANYGCTTAKRYQESSVSVMTSR